MARLKSSISLENVQSRWKAILIFFNLWALRENSCPQFWGRKWLRANFMGAWKKCALAAGKTHVHKIPPFRGGGGILGWGGGDADFIL